MKTELTPIAMAVALALGGTTLPSWGQSAPPTASPPAATPPAATPAPQLAQAQDQGAAQPQQQPPGTETIMVTGVRASVQKSLETKRKADSVVEVITAEDIGKLPDKNIADSLSHLTGLNISSAGATEGGFDENDRVSIRGTNPSLTLTTMNGHGVASGDWFVLNQTTNVGRSVSYTLLPSELVSQVIVHKSSEAADIEGGVAGTVDIMTRKPLDFTKPLTLEVSGGAVYADLPSKTDPQFNALANWKNDQGNFGVMGQAFYEDRHLRRDGQELLTYEQFGAQSNVVLGKNGNTPHPDLANVWYPGYIGSVLFDQERRRTGGLLDVQFKPSNDISLDASYFISHLEATNYNRNYILWLTHLVSQGSGQAPDPGYTITNGTLTSANFSPVPGNIYGVYDQISRPDESASTNFFALDGKWKAADNLTFLGKTGLSWGDGKTPRQDVLETNPGIGSGGGYSLAGLSSAASWNLGNTVNNTPTPGGVPVAFGWIFGDQNVDIKDAEGWAQLDGTYSLADGALSDLRFGLRFGEHRRASAGVIGQGPSAGASKPANWPQGFQNYPSNFGADLGGNFPRNVWYFTPGQLAAYDGLYTNRNPVTREDWNSEYSLNEISEAGYVQGDLEGQGWSGNVGLRLTETREHAINNLGVAAGYVGAINTSAFGPFIGVHTDHSYFDVLPSANLKIDITRDLLARFAAAQTLARPDYGFLAGPVILGGPPEVSPNPGVGSGSGSNPDLRPLKSTNLDAGLEWYFAKRSLLAAGLFYMNLHDYVSYGQVTRNLLTFGPANSGYNQATGNLVPYDLTVPVNANGRVEGLELAYEQAILENFGFKGNFTLANGRQTSPLSPVLHGDNRLVGDSKDTYNLGGYFENKHFNAQVNYTYRSSFYSGLDRSTAFTQDSYGTLNMTVGYAYDEHLSVQLDMLNLNNPIQKYYALNPDQPRAFYENGRQYYATVRYKF